MTFPAQTDIALGARLCTLAQVKARAQYTTTSDDSRIDTIIAAVTRTAAVRYGREFVSQAAATRTFEVTGHLVSLNPYDLRSTTAVTLNGVALMEGTDYILSPEGADPLTGTYGALQLATRKIIGASTRSADFGHDLLVVTGGWGIWSDVTAVPLDINEAAIETVLSWLNKPSTEIAAIDSSNPAYRAVAVPQSWDFPLSAHRKFGLYSRNLGAW